MFIMPMLLERYDEPFDDSDYIFEPKIDGHRLIYSHLNGITRLFSRSHVEITPLYPELFHIEADDDILLDGEVAIVNPSTGLIDYESIKERFDLRKKRDILFHSIHNPVNYIVFDILFYKGKDLRGLPLMKRREILNAIVLGNPNIGKIPFIEANGCTMFEEIRARKMEGIVAKHKDSRYIGQRSEDWLKIVNWQQDDFYITGYTHDKSSLLLSTPGRPGGFRQVGLVTKGMTPVQKMTFFTVCRQLIESSDEINIYLKPEIKATIQYRNFTWAGTLRTPRFVSFAE